MPTGNDAHRWSASLDNVYSPFGKITLLFLALVSILIVIPYPRSSNDQSRLAAIESVVERGTLVIDNSTFVDTRDKIFVNGHFYSDKTPLSSLIGAVVYLPLHYLGFRLSLGWSVAYFCITFFTVKALWVLSLLAFHATLGLMRGNQATRTIHTLAFGLASLHLSWSSVYNNHSLAASLITIAFYFYMRSRQTARPARDMFASGLLFSLAGNIDVPTAAFYTTFLLLILLDAARRRHVAHYLLPALILAVPALAMNYSITGGFAPLQTDPAYFDYPGSPWKGAEKLSGTEMNSLPFFLSYTLDCLFGRRGFLLYNPLLFAFIPYLVREMFGRSGFKKESIGIVITSAIIMLYYFLYTSNYGGDSYSIRWFVPLLPLLYLGGYGFFDNFSGFRKKAFVLVFAAAVCISAIGMTNPWAESRWSRTPLINNVLSLLHRLF
jgi:hypothetical protein